MVKGLLFHVTGSSVARVITRICITWCESFVTQVMDPPTPGLEHTEQITILYPLGLVSSPFTLFKYITVQATTTTTPKQGTNKKPVVNSVTFTPLSSNISSDYKEMCSYQHSVGFLLCHNNTSLTLSTISLIGQF